MSRKNLFGIAAVVLLMGAVGSAQAAKPDDAGAGRAAKAGEQRALVDERRADCINSSEHDCAGVQKGLVNKFESDGKASESGGLMTGKGHERGDEPGKHKGLGQKGKAE